MNSEAIIWGVACGVIAGVFLQAMVAIFRSIIIPWYQELIYKGVDLCGEWHSRSTLADGNISEEVFQVSQHAQKLKCLITITERTRQNNFVYQKSFNAAGYIKDRLISLQSENVNKKQIGQGVYLLELNSGGSEMKGVEAWYSVSKNEVLSSTTTIYRKSA